LGRLWVNLRFVRLRSILATFLGSFLLFLLEPMVAKALLPRFGGSSLVWNGSLLFFQALLLAGYAYAHVAVRRLGLARGVRLHFVVLGLAVVGLALFAGPWLWAERPVSDFPIGDLLLTLFLTTALPFFTLSAGTPLIQRWFGASGDPAAGDPYFLYAASNLGSFVGLIAYPVLVEPLLGLQAQRYAFAAGVLVYALVLLTSAGPALRAAPTVEADVDWRVPPRLALRWVLLAAAPSALLLAITSELTKNVAPIPLLWVLPLGLYLVTFIIAFSMKKQAGLERYVGYALPIVLFPAAAFLVAPSQLLAVSLVITLLTFFVLTLACHLELARQRPEPRLLTAFYLWLSVGGALGGLFVALVAPVVFQDLTELPIALFGCTALYAWSNTMGPQFKWKWLDVVWPLATLGLFLVFRLWVTKHPNEWNWLFVIMFAFLGASLRPVRFSLTFGAFLLGNQIVDWPGPLVLEQKRNYYGQHTVARNREDTWHDLSNGTTLHGAQCVAPGFERVPHTYYAERGPCGQALIPTLKSRPNATIGVVGLGSGTVAAYGRAGDTIRFFELNPAIKRMAYDRKLFTYVTDSAADVDVKLGDARLSLESEPDGKFDVIVLDAFSSDSIPVHLLTVEALELYKRKLKPNGLLMVHTSNRFLRLARVVVATGAKAGFVADVGNDYSSEHIFVRASTSWVALARDISVLKPIEGDEYHRVSPLADAPVWTDDYSNVFSILKWR
jgi:SAM-dependent methyltransferase